MARSGDGSRGLPGAGQPLLEDSGPEQQLSIRIAPAPLRASTVSTRSPCDGGDVEVVPERTGGERRPAARAHMPIEIRREVALRRSPLDLGREASLHRA